VRRMAKAVTVVRVNFILMIARGKRVGIVTVDLCSSCCDVRGVMGESLREEQARRELNISNLFAWENGEVRLTPQSDRRPGVTVDMVD
jgi:sulfur relay (sulfurtransferase) complex TusBCD TusD component (DsrE family)